MSKNSSNSRGIGVVGLLGIAFVVLKLIGTINWSWWWVTAPFWGGAFIVIAIMLILTIIGIIAESIK